jgi:hypothetical protein
MTERRFDEAEVAAIFARAADDTVRAPAVQHQQDEGLTLAELQDIGREVGIAPDAVALAARSVALRPRAAVRTLLGLPIGVGRTVVLDRRLTEAEWELLVVELRDTFHARGQLNASGSLRQWTNGNLQVLLEPDPRGSRLRLSTVNGGARVALTAGSAMVGIAAVTAISSAIGGHLAASMSGVMVLLLSGIGVMASGALRVPSWARLRGRQMDAIAMGLALPEGDGTPGTPPV